MKVPRLLRLTALIAVMGAFLAACSSSPPPPAAATVNGVTNIDRQNGSVEFSVSGLDAQGDLVTTGTVSFNAATVDQTGYTVGGAVCGGAVITNRGAIVGALTLDGSGSLVTTDPTQQRAVAARAFVQRMGVDDVAVVTAFRGSSHTAYSEFTSDKALLYDAIDRATYASGQTPLWVAAYQIVSYLAAQTGSNKMALIFTDGMDTEGIQTPATVINHALNEGVRLYMVGLGSPGSIETANMINVSTGTGGMYSSTSDPAALQVNFTNIFSASKASGCIGLVFNPPPAPNQTVTGSINFNINGKPFTGDYAVTF